MSAKSGETHWDTLQKRQFDLQLRGGQAVSKYFCMPYVPGLHSPYDKVGRLVYFGRMLDKRQGVVRGEAVRSCLKKGEPRYD